MRRRLFARIGTAVTLTGFVVLLPVAAFASGGTASGADLQVAGSASTGSPAPGAPLSYTFQVKSSGPDVANSVVFNDLLPSGTIYNFATVNGSTLPCAAIGDLTGGTTASCNLGSLAKGGQATVVVNVNAPTSLISFSNTGTATSATTDPAPGNNSATVTVTVKASNKNGVNDVAPTVAAPCATLTNLAVPVGYYSVWAAIWNDFTIKSCSTSSEIVNVEVTELNVATGLLDYDLVMPFSLTTGSSSSMVLDNDFAPFDTSYTITFTATDQSGNVLASGSLSAVTPPPR